MARRQYVARKTRPLVVICSEGKNSTAERIYFANFTDRNCRIKFCTGSSTDPVGMLEDFKKYIKNPAFLLDFICWWQDLNAGLPPANPHRKELAGALTWGV